MILSILSYYFLKEFGVLGLKMFLELGWGRNGRLEMYLKYLKYKEK